MKIKYNSELIAGIIFMLLSAVGLALLNQEVQTMETSAVNARTIPSLALIIMFLCSAGLLVQGISKPKKMVQITGDMLHSVTGRRRLKPILFSAMLIVYAVIFKPVGFILSSLLLATGILAFYHSKKYLYYLIAYITIGVVFVVFKYFLNVNLPSLFIH